MTDIIYEINDLVQGYKGKQVLSIDRLQVMEGEILAVIGPSGAGKSTLLRLLNFLESPTRGSIQFQKAEFNSGKTVPLELRRKVTTVFQQPVMLNQSVKKNVQYGLRMRGNRDGKFKVEETLKEVGLSEVCDQKATTLSGGETQRVALARAMIIDPEVLLLDEPTANLDPYNVGLIEKIIKDLNRDRRLTMVLVTHNVFQARRLADRVAFLLDGKLIEIGTAEKIFDHPTDSRTTSFINGEMVY